MPVGRGKAKAGLAEGLERRDLGRAGGEILGSPRVRQLLDFVGVNQNFSVSGLSVVLPFDRSVIMSNTHFVGASA